MSKVEKKIASGGLGVQCIEQKPDYLSSIVYYFKFIIEKSPRKRTFSVFRDIYRPERCEGDYRCGIVRLSCRVRRPCPKQKKAKKDYTHG